MDKLQLGVPEVKIDVYEHGVMTHKKVHVILPPGKQIGAKRGKIEKWSLASRRRMREMLLTSAPPDGWITGGVTYTIPGPVPTYEEARQLWADHCSRVNKLGWAMIWRMEVQERGALHWHTIVTLPHRSGQEERGSLALRSLELQELWAQALKRMGEVEHETKNGRWKITATRDCLPGAWRHAVEVELHPPIRGGHRLTDPQWLRYLQDHATKVKQVAGPGAGRHWGVVGRRHWRKVPSGETLLAGNEAAFHIFLRALQRLCTASHKVPGVPFGRRLNKRLKRGHRGSAVWFSDPGTLRKLAKWAESEAASRDPIIAEAGEDSAGT